MVEQRTDIDHVIQKCKELVKDQYLIRVRLPATTVAEETGGDSKKDEEEEMKDEECFVIPPGYFLCLSCVFMVGCWGCFGQSTG